LRLEFLGLAFPFTYAGMFAFVKIVCKKKLEKARDIAPFFQFFAHLKKNAYSRSSSISSNGYVCTYPAML